MSAFEVLVTEVLLARTRAEAVERVAPALLERYPDAKCLARGQKGEVERLLRPLGLFRKRTRALIGCARMLAERHDGAVPRAHKSLVALPYVGRYAANAIGCFAFGERRPIVDANVARVLTRVFGVKREAADLASAEALWRLGERLLPVTRVRDYNWALLDLGGLVCTAARPSCAECPVAELCGNHRSRRCGCDRAGA